MERVFLIRSEDSFYVCPSVNSTVSLARKFLEMGEDGGAKLCIETRSKESFDRFLNDTSAADLPSEKRKYKKREEKERVKKVKPVATKRGRKKGLITTSAKIVALLGRKGELANEQLQGYLGITGEAVRQHLIRLIAQNKVEISGENPRTFKLTKMVTFQCAARGRKIESVDCVPNKNSHDCMACDYKDGN